MPQDAADRAEFFGRSDPLKHIVPRMAASLFMKTTGFPRFNGRPANRTGDETNHAIRLCIGECDRKRATGADANQFWFVEVQRINGGGPRARLGECQDTRMHLAILLFHSPAACHIRLPGQNVQIKLWWRILWNGSMPSDEINDLLGFWMREMVAARFFRAFRPPIIYGRRGYCTFR